MQLFRARTYPGEVLAIDIGGTKMAIGLVSGDGELGWSTRVLTPPGGSAAELWSSLAALVASVPADASPAGCGVGCGGPMSRNGELVSPLNIPGWRGFPL